MVSFAARAADAAFDGAISTYEREEYEACAQRLWLIAGGSVGGADEHEARHDRSAGSHARQSVTLEGSQEEERGPNDATRSPRLADGAS